MRKNNITIVINDANRFYVDGLAKCLSADFSNQGIHTDFTDCVFNSRAKMLFLAEDSLSVANIHYLNRRMSMRPLCIFIIKDSETKDDPGETKVHSIHHYATLYRDQAVDSTLSVINKQREQLQSLRNILVQPCSNRITNNLTRRETEILRYLARGISNGGVARFLHISEKTVSAHKRNIMSKLNMVRPAELNYWLIQEGWCDSLRKSEPFH